MPISNNDETLGAKFRSTYSKACEEKKISEATAAKEKKEAEKAAAKERGEKLWKEHIANLDAIACNLESACERASKEKDDDGLPRTQFAYKLKILSEPYPKTASEAVGWFALEAMGRTREEAKAEEELAYSRIKDVARRLDVGIKLPGFLQEELHKHMHFSSCSNIVLFLDSPYNAAAAGIKLDVKPNIKQENLDEIVEPRAPNAKEPLNYAPFGD